MEYLYAALLLHALGKKVDEAGLTNVLKAAEANVDEARIKVLVSALEGINIDEALKAAATFPAAPVTPPAPAPAAAPAEKKEEKKEEEALAGLAALFG